MTDGDFLSIGALADRTGLAVRTIRFYSDAGVVPETARNPSGYRLYGAEAVARLDLVRTLRDLGLSLSTIRSLLAEQESFNEVAAAHVNALDVQIARLRLRRAVLRAAIKTTTTTEEAALMHKLVTMSDPERQRVIEDFVKEAFEGVDANPELVALLRTMKPELPEDPEPAQVEAWIQLADLVRDPDFRASARRMAQHQAAERAAGDQTGLHHDLTVVVTERVRAAIDAGIDPTTSTAAEVVDELMTQYAATFHTIDTPAYRGAVLRRVEIANDPRVERYFQLLGQVNGWPEQPSLVPVFDWFTTALRAHKDAESGARNAHGQKPR